MMIWRQVIIASEFSSAGTSVLQDALATVRGGNRAT